MKYRCKKTLFVTLYDGDGFTTEDYDEIKEGTTWIEDEDKWRCIGGEVRLLREGCSIQWLETSKKTLEDHFELIK